MIIVVEARFVSQIVEDVIVRRISLSSAAVSVLRVAVIALATMAMSVRVIFLKMGNVSIRVKQMAQAVTTNCFVPITRPVRGVFAEMERLTFVKTRLIVRRTAVMKLRRTVFLRPRTVFAITDKLVTLVRDVLVQITGCCATGRACPRAVVAVNAILLPIAPIEFVMIKNV